MLHISKESIMNRVIKHFKLAKGFEIENFNPYIHITNFKTVLLSPFISISF